MTILYSYATTKDWHTELEKVVNAGSTIFELSMNLIYFDLLIAKINFDYFLRKKNIIMWLIYNKY